MKDLEEVKIQSTDGQTLSLAVYESGDARGCIQLIHGMAEHKERYDDFARFLNENGYNVITSDLRGHGKGAPLLSHISDKDGDKLLISDQQAITAYINGRFGNMPVYLFAHSMGTIIARVLLQSDSGRYRKAVFSGYVCPNPLSGFAFLLSNMIRYFKGSRKRSRLLTSLALGPYIMSVSNRKTPHDWLTYNEANVEAYINDPLSGVEFTTGSYSALFALTSKMSRASGYRNVNPELDILLLSGIDDPCAGGSKGRSASKEVLEAAGFKNISVITYRAMRHEILNETDKGLVYRDVLDFLNK